MTAPPTDPLDTLAERVAAGGVLVLSGAGLSTDSGIPDYRGEGAARRPHTPMTYETFVGDADARRRYWARSQVGWRRVAGAHPNPGHYAVAEIERLGLTAGIVTQNVDGLHQAAGATSVVDLHGRLDRVVCLACGTHLSRRSLDFRLRAANPGFATSGVAMNPDGDAEVPADALAGFTVVDCEHCGGMLKPDVVFFGENVKRATVARCFEMLEAARLLLVLGSSLTVMSGYRFVRRATQRGIPVAIVNRGPTRGDVDASIRLAAGLSESLTGLAERLGVRLAVPASAALPRLIAADSSG